MKNVLITGGARGIGKELNKEFKNNFTPIVTDLTDDKCINIIKKYFI